MIEREGEFYKTKPIHPEVVNPREVLLAPEGLIREILCEVEDLTVGAGIGSDAFRSSRGATTKQNTRDFMRVEKHFDGFGAVDNYKASLIIRPTFGFSWALQDWPCLRWA